MSLDFLESKDIEKLQKDIFENVKKVYKLSSFGLIYDVTNTYFCGKKCSIGKFGKDKDGVSGRPLIQIGLGVTFNQGIPIFHKVFDGNIHDSKTLRDIVTTFQNYKIRRGIFVFDRGITSKVNLSEIKNILKWDVLCGLALNPSLKKTLRMTIKTEKIVQYSNRIRLKNAIFYVIEKESRYDEISNAKKLLQKGKEIKSELKTFFDKKGNILVKELEKKEELEGYFCLFTTKASISCV